MTDQFRIASTTPIPVGQAGDAGGRLRLRRRRFGKGATVTLSANGTKIGEGRVDKTVPLMYGIDGFDIGGDYGSPVSPDYQAAVRLHRDVGAGHHRSAVGRGAPRRPLADHGRWRWPAVGLHRGRR